MSDVARRALLRGAVLAGLLGAAFPVMGGVLLAAGYPGAARDLVFWAIGGVVYGLLSAPALAVEPFAERVAPSVRRDVATFLAAGLAGAASALVALFQVIFTVTCAEKGPEAGLAELGRFVDEVHAHRREAGALVGMALPLGVPFGCVAVSRLRGLRLWKEVSVSGGATLVVAGVIAFVQPYGSGLRDGVYAVLFGVTAAFGVCLPLAARAGERLERGLRAWLEGEHP